MIYLKWPVPQRESRLQALLDENSDAASMFLITPLPVERGIECCLNLCAFGMHAETLSHSATRSAKTHRPVGVDLPENKEEDTLQAIAEHLARECGRTVVECWADALSIWRVQFDPPLPESDEDE